jgi:hypothetical protein
MKTFNEFLLEEDGLLNEQKTLKAIVLMLRVKQGQFASKIKNEKDLEKKIDLVSQQIASATSIVLAGMYSLDMDLKKLLRS